MRAWLLVALAVAAAAVALAYLGTDDAFRGLWFPKLAEVAGVEASAAEATWDPLSGFTAKGVRFSGKGGIAGEIEEIQASWNPAEIFRATVALNSLSVTGARVEWRTGKRGGGGGGGDKDEAARRGGPTVLGFAVECGPVALRRIEVVARAPRGGLCMTNRIESIELSGWRPGSEVRAKARVGMAGSLWEGLELEGGLLSCDMKLSLNPKLEINGAEGWVRFGECRGRSGEMRLDGLEFEQTIQLTPYWLRSAVATASMKGRPLGRCAANGAVDFNLKTCDLVVLVEGIDPELVSAVTASRGLWMTKGTMRVTGQYQVLKASRRIQGDAEMKGACFDRKAGASAFPPIEGRCAFAAEHFPDARELVLERAQVSLVEGDSVVAAAGLDRPMRLSWGKQAQRGEAAELALRVPETDLRRLAHFVEAACGARLQGGIVGGRGRLVAMPGGREVRWEGSLAARDLVGDWRGESLAGMAVSAGSSGRWMGEAVLEVSNAAVRVEGPPEKSAVIWLSGARSGKGETWKLGGSLGRDWLRGWANPRFGVTGGSVEGSAEVVRSTNGTGAVKWVAAGKGLAGEGGPIRLEDLGIEVRGEVAMGAGEERVCRASAVVRPGGDGPPCELLVEGPWRDGLGGGRIEARLRGWGEEGLARVLRPGPASRVCAGKGLEGLVVIQRVPGKWAVDGMVALRETGSAGGARGKDPAVDLVLALKGGVGSGRVDIESGSFSAGRVGDSENRLAVSGGFRTDGQGVDLTITAPVFDPKPILPLLAAWGAESDGGVARDEGPGAAPAVGEVPGPDGGRRDVPDGQVAGAQDGRLGFAIERLLLGDVEAKLTGQIVKSGSRWRDGVASLISGSGQLVCRMGWPKPGAWEAEARADAFPAKAAGPFVAAPSDFLDGVVSGDARLAGGGGWRPESLRGAGRVSWSGARGERLPAIRSFLKSASKRVTPELAECRVSGLAGSFEVTGGDWRSQDLLLSGDLMKLWYLGGVDHRGRIDGEARFAGKTDMMRRARVRLGDVEVGGSTFVAFGRPDGEFTVLPGSLPVRGDMGGELEADWDGWLKSVGLGAFSGLIEGLGGSPGRTRDDGREK